MHKRQRLLLTASACLLVASLGVTTLSQGQTVHAYDELQEAYAGESLEDFLERGGNAGYSRRDTTEGDRSIVTFTRVDKTEIPIEYHYDEKIHEPFGWEEKTLEGVAGEITTTHTIRFVDGVMTRSDRRDEETKSMTKGVIEKGSLYETFYYGSYEFEAAESGGMNQVPFEKERTYQRGHNANIDPLTGEALLLPEDRIVLVGNYKHIRDVGITPAAQYVLDLSMPADSRDKLVQSGTRTVITTDIVYDVDEAKGTLSNPKETVQEFPGRPNIYHYAPVSIAYETDIRTVPYSEHGDILTVVQPGIKGLEDPRTGELLEAPQTEILEIMEGYELVRQPNGSWGYQQDPNFNDSSSTGGGDVTRPDDQHQNDNDNQDDGLIRFDSESIEFETKYEFDPNLPAGERVVKQEGSIGVWDEKKGELIVEPIDEIIIIGGKVDDVYEANPNLPKGDIETSPGREPEIDLETGKVIKDGEPTKHSIGTKEVIEEEITFETERRGDITADPNAEDKVINEGEDGLRVTTRQHEIDPTTGEFTGKFTETVEESDPKNKVVSGYPKPGDTNWEELIKQGLIDEDGNLIKDDDHVDDDDDDNDDEIKVEPKEEPKVTVPIDQDQGGQNSQVTRSGHGLLHQVVTDQTSGNRYAQVIGDGLIYDYNGQLIGDGHLYDQYGHRVGSPDDLAHTGSHRGFRSRYYNPNEHHDVRFDLGNNMRLAELYDSHGNPLDLTQVYTSQGQRISELDLRDEHGRKLWGDNQTLAAPGSAQYQQQTRQQQSQLPRQQQLQNRGQAGHTSGQAQNDLPTTGEVLTNVGLLGGLATAIGAVAWPKRQRKKK